MIKAFLSLLLWGVSMTPALASGPCTGHFINPITDVCWSCLLPITIGNIPVAHGSLPDTSNPSSPVGVCPSGLFFKVGLNMGYWEPFAVTDVTPTPYCMVNMGGITMDLGLDVGQGGPGSYPHNDAFYSVHWYNYPLISWMNLITASGCLQSGEFDIGWFSEIDPTWQDDELTALLNPDAFLFANPVSQAACSADSIAASTGSLPMDSLFWCAGSQGAMYPLSGHVGEVSSPLQAAVLLSERMDYKLHREGLINDTDSGNLCHEIWYETMPKSRYRYQLVNTIADASHCYPFGHTTLDWEAGNLNPADANNFGFLIWRKRNCTYY